MSKYMNGFQVVIKETCPEESGCLVPPGHNLPSSQVNHPTISYVHSCPFRFWIVFAVIFFQGPNLAIGNFY